MPFKLTGQVKSNQSKEPMFELSDLGQINRSYRATFCHFEADFIMPISKKSFPQLAKPLDNRFLL